MIKTTQIAQISQRRSIAFPPPPLPPRPAGPVTVEGTVVAVPLGWVVLGWVGAVVVVVVGGAAALYLHHKNKDGQ